MQIEKGERRKEEGVIPAIINIKGAKWRTEQFAFMLAQELSEAIRQHQLAGQPEFAVAEDGWAKIPGDIARLYLIKFGHNPILRMANRINLDAGLIELSNVCFVPISDGDYKKSRSFLQYQLIMNRQLIAWCTLSHH